MLNLLDGMERFVMDCNSEQDVDDLKKVTNENCNMYGVCIKQNKINDSVDNF